MTAAVAKVARPEVHVGVQVEDPEARGRRPGTPRRTGGEHAWSPPSTIGTLPAAYRGRISSRSEFDHVLCAPELLGVARGRGSAMSERSSPVSRSYDSKFQECWRIESGPNRAPGRKEVVRSNGMPTITTYSDSSREADRVGERGGTEHGQRTSVGYITWSGDRGPLRRDARDVRRLPHQARPDPDLPVEDLHDGEGEDRGPDRHRRTARRTPQTARNTAPTSRPEAPDGRVDQREEAEVLRPVTFGRDLARRRPASPGRPARVPRSEPPDRGWSRSSSSRKGRSRRCEGEGGPVPDPPDLAPPVDRAARAASRRARRSGGRRSRRCSPRDRSPPSCTRGSRRTSPPRRSRSPGWRPRRRTWRQAPSPATGRGGGSG